MSQGEWASFEELHGVTPEFYASTVAEIEQTLTERGMDRLADTMIAVTRGRLQHALTQATREGNERVARTILDLLDKHHSMRSIVVQRVVEALDILDNEGNPP